MRLITHNMLCCNIKGITNGYPFRIEVDRCDVVESEFNAEFTSNMMKKIEYDVLVTAAASLGYADLPATSDLTAELKADEAFLRKVHHALFDLHLIDGRLVCPESSRGFPVKGGIPNMLLHEDEV